MPEYKKNKVYDSMLVDSIVTVRERDLRKKESSGESHDFPEIIFIKEGYTNLCLDTKIIPLNKGQLIIIAPNTFHGNLNCALSLGTAIHSIISFETSTPTIKPIYNTPITLDNTQIEQYLKIISNGIKIFEEIKESDMHIGMTLKTNVASYEAEKLKKQLELFLLELFHNYFNTTIDKQAHKKLLLLTEYLNTNITKKLSAEDISKNLFISYSTIRKMTRKYYGCGPLEYFIDLKINEAKRLIKLGNMNFTEISEYLGFGTVHYFSRQFKARVGKSPSAYLNDIN